MNIQREVKEIIEQSNEAIYVSDQLALNALTEILFQVWRQELGLDRRIVILDQSSDAPVS